ALVAEYPGIPDHRLLLNRALSNLGNLLNEVGRSREAEATYRRAVAGAERLQRDQPSVPLYLQNLAMYLHNLADHLKNADRDADAEELFRRSIDQFERVAELDPSGLGRGFYLRATRGDALGRLGELSLKRHDRVEARRLFESALTDIDSALKI